MSTGTPSPRRVASLRHTLLAVALAFSVGACGDASLSRIVAPDPGAPVASEGAADAARFVAGEVLVSFRPGAARSEIAEAHRAQKKDELLDARVWVLSVPAGEELAIAGMLAKNPNVEFAEPNWILDIRPCGIGDCAAPTDAFFNYKWDLFNAGSLTLPGEVVTTGVARADISWLEAHEYLQETGGAGGTARVGIIDSGIRGTHVEFAGGRLVAARNFVPPTCFLGICFGTVNPNAWQDDVGHGTHVAGIAAAPGSHGGVPGVAFGPNIQVVVAKVCGNQLAGCPTASIANGIRWAADQGVHVMNLSLGGGAAQATIQSALQYAVGKGVLPICASGNDGANAVSWPAAFPECMAVGSTNWSDGKATYSNYGPQIEISAPGGDVETAPYSYILSSWSTANDAYGFAAGTSMAAPQVAGLAGLLHSVGVTGAANIRARIRETADDLGPAGVDQQFGSGRINVYRAITQRDPSIPFTVSTRSNVNARSQGMLQVVLLDQDAVTFGLDMVTISSLTLGGTPLAVRPNGTHFATSSDVDLDGRDDLVLHFSVSQLRASGALTGATTELVLRGTLTDGRTIRAAVSIAAH